MAAKRLTAMLAGVSLLATITQASAQASDQRMWLNTGDWTVWQITDPARGRSCFAKHIMETEGGRATFGLSQNDTRTLAMLHYTEDGLQWTNRGEWALQVDNYGPWRVQTSTVSDDGSGLGVSLGASNDVRTFVNQLRYGSVLRITTTVGTRVFSLAGSAQAIGALEACIASIYETRNGSPPTASAPHLPAPRWPAVPRPVVPTAPATML